MVTGLTTAATLWIVTVLGLLFGGGQLVLASASSAITFLILWGVRKAEFMLHRERDATLHVSCAAGSNLDETALRGRIASGTCSIASWHVVLAPDDRIQSIDCELRILSRRDLPGTPLFVHKLAALPEIQRVSFRF